MYVLYNNVYIIEWHAIVLVKSTSNVSSIIDKGWRHWYMRGRRYNHSSMKCWQSNRMGSSFVLLTEWGINDNCFEFDIVIPWPVHVILVESLISMKIKEPLSYQQLKLRCRKYLKEEDLYLNIFGMYWIAIHPHIVNPFKGSEAGDVTSFRPHFQCTYK